jgi:hypothetical protein
MTDATPMTAAEHEQWLMSLKEGDYVVVYINGKSHQGHIAISGVDDVFVEGESIRSGSFYRSDGASHDRIWNAVLRASDDRVGEMAGMIGETNG